jgi:hypothetical protein
MGSDNRALKMILWNITRTSFQFPAASGWNKLQQTLKLDSFISISSFEDSITDALTDSFGCFV